MAGMLGIIAESFLTKIGDKLFDYAEHNLRGITDYVSTFQSLKRNLRSLSAKATDVEEEIKNAELSGKKKRKREVENWLEEVKELGDELHTLESEVNLEGSVTRFLGGDRATEFKVRVDQLVEQSKHFGELVLDAPETKGTEFLKTKLVGKGFEENLERIWKVLREDNVKSIGIYGMGGVGKTTLAEHINNQLLGETEESVFWVTVSEVFSISMLQHKIAKVIGLHLSDEDAENKRAAILYQALSSRKHFVLILDDVWDNIDMEKVGFPLHVEGCRLIITTRSLQVCRQIGCQQVIPVKTLDTDEAWNLFSEKLGQEITTLPDDVRKIAKSIAKLCDGLPLGIITLAGGMRGETSIPVWRNALKELQKFGHDDIKDNVFKVLKYSFNRLDPKHQTRGSNEEYTKLQRCFLYCSLYPEDCKIKRNELVRKFISEELVDKTEGWGAQVDEGVAILNKLVNVSLLESDTNYEGVDCVKIHDLVRVMALKITQEKYEVLVGRQLKKISNEKKYRMKEKMSLMWTDIKEIPDGISPNWPNLSTLLLHSNASLKFIADSFFSQMHGLCVLDLSYNQAITMLPNSLSDLISLKALLLGGLIKIESVPYLGRLKALKELDLSHTSIKEVPQGMEDLHNLNILSMAYTKYLEDLPKGLLLKLTYLHCLHLPYHILSPVEEIERLEQLEEFQGRVNDVSDFNRLMRSRQHNQIRFIQSAIHVGNFIPSFIHVVNFILKPKNNKNYFNVSMCNLSQEDMHIMLPDTVQYLALVGCEGLSRCLLDDFPKLNNPKSIQQLVILKGKGIECIMEKQEIGVEAGVALPAPAQAVFSSLTKLKLCYCLKIKKLGLTGSEFPNIEEIHVEYCKEIEEIIEQGEGEADVVHFPKLKELYLRELPRLKSICKARMKCDSIEKISIGGCRELKRIPLDFPKKREPRGISFITSYSPPPALKQIWIDTRWEWNSLEWDHPSQKQVLQPFVKQPCFFIG